MKLLKQGILLFTFLLIFWIFFTNTSTQEILAGILVSLILTVVFLGKSSVFAEIHLTPKSLNYAVAYVFVFLGELIKSNLDVARRVLSPQLPIHPGIVKVKTRLTSRLGRTALANSITLTPGTLTVEIHGDYFYIHWIDVTADNIDDTSKAIVSKFEKYLEVIFG